MKVQNLLLITTLAILGGGCTQGVQPMGELKHAQQSTAGPEQTEAIIRNLLMREPSIVRAALDADRKQQDDRIAAEMEERMRPIASTALSNVGGDYPTYGSTDLGPTIVEAMDYNCGFCKRFHSEGVLPLMNGGQAIKVRIVFHPILNEGSVRMAELAAAAHLMGKFQVAHVFLLNSTAHDRAAADKLIPGLAKAIGAEPKAILDTLASGKPAALLKKHTDQTAQLQMGTPAIWVNNRLIPGFIGAEELYEKLGRPLATGVAGE